MEVPVGSAFPLNRIWMEALGPGPASDGGSRFRGMFNIRSGYQGILLTPETLPALGGLANDWAASVAVETELSVEPRADDPPGAPPPGVAVLVGAWYRFSGAHGGVAVGRVGDTLVVTDRFDGRHRSEIASVPLPPGDAAPGVTPRTTLRVEREGGVLRVWVDGERVGDAWRLPRELAGRVGLTVLDTEPGAVLRVHALRIQRRRG